MSLSLLGHSNKAVLGTEDVPHLVGRLPGLNKALVFCPQYLPVWIWYCARAKMSKGKERKEGKQNREKEK